MYVVQLELTGTQRLSRSELLTMQQQEERIAALEAYIQVPLPPQPGIQLRFGSNRPEFGC